MWANSTPEAHMRQSPSQGQQVPGFRLTTAWRGHTPAHKRCEDLFVLGLNADGVAKAITGGPFRHSRPAYPSWERAAQASSARKLFQILGKQWIRTKALPL